MICPICYNPQPLTESEVAEGKTQTEKNEELEAATTLVNDVCPTCEREWAYDTDPNNGRISNIYPVES